MKILYTTLLGSVAAAALTTSALAQVAVTESSTTTTTTTTQAGTITQYAPGSSLVIRQEGGAAPITYGVTRETAFVDENGTVVQAENVTPGAPITVNYVRQGDRLVASRVIVRRSTPAVSRTTTTTTTVTPQDGTITEWSAGSPTIVVRTASGPLSYAVAGSTVFVDENGNPVAASAINAGLPVTVHYTRDGDRLVASRVVVTHAQKPRKLSEDEKEALEDAREAQKDFRKAQREREEELREKREERREERRDERD